MDEGPTTAGSIVAKLRMDRDKWVADKAKTKADAQELGALRPTIRVEMNTAQALAQIEAVRLAADRLNVISGLPGSDIEGTNGYRAREKAVLELSAAEAVLAASTDKVAAADVKAIVAEDALTAAEERSTASKVKANAANQTTVSRMGLIVAAVATLVPLLVPVAAFTVGAAGGLTMMGVAGVLAIVGIRKEMAASTPVGNQYSAGLQSLKGDLDQLSNTAAVGMLRYFNGSVGQINASMPMLNGQIGVFTRLLGQSGSNLLSGTLSSLRVLNPLFVTVGQYVDGLTLKFARWTENGGLQKFGNYAMSVLPTVEQFLSALGNAVFHLLAALAPMGEVGLAVFTGLFNAISAVPVDVLTNLITAVVYGTLAFKAWGFIAPMLAGVAEAMGAVGVATTIATGPIGWVVAGIAALAAVLALSVTTSNEAAAAVNSYATSLQQDNGVIGENVRLQAAKNLQDGGAIKLAKDLGIETDKLTEAALGNKDAQKTVNDALNKQAESYAQVSTGSATFIARSIGLSAAQRQTKADVDNTRNTLTTQQAALKLAIASYNDLANAQGLATISTKAQLVAEQANAAAAHVSLSAYMAASAGMAGTAAALEKTTAMMYLQNDAAGLLKMQLDSLNGKTLSAAQAQNQFDSGLANMTQKAGAAGAALEGNSSAAAANRGELINLTTTALANAQAFRDNGHSSEEARQKLIDMKQAIIDNAVAHGENRDQVQSYVDTLYKIPDSIPATKIEVDTANAEAALKAFVARWQGASINLTATGSGKLGSGILGHAGGGTVRGPGTGTSDSVLRRMSNGEEVIKTASASQARPFLKAFNENPQRALASVATASPATGSNVMQNHLHIDGNGLDPDALFKEFNRRLLMQRA